MIGFSPKLVACTLILCLLALTSSNAPWVASGTGFSPEKLDFIHETIRIAHDAELDNATRALNISETLNAAYMRFWNVLAATVDQGGNAVVYGYSFNDQWLWINHFQGSNVSYVIWKDYNCQEEFDVPQTMQLQTWYVRGVADQTELYQLEGIQFFRNATQESDTRPDLWKTLFGTIYRLDEEFNSTFTGLMFEVPQAFNPGLYSFRFCVENNGTIILTNSFKWNGTLSQAFSTNFIGIQMRDSYTPIPAQDRVSLEDVVIST